MRAGPSIVLVLVLALGLVVIAGTADAQQRQGADGQPGGPANAQPMRAGGSLEDVVYLRLAERAWAGADFKVNATDGTVTISGTVPSDEAKRRVVRVIRRTPGVDDVRDQLRVDAAVTREQAEAPRVSDDELERRVAERVAQAIPGAKAGESWWFRGWRVEGPDNVWNFDVDVEQADVRLDGDVPRAEIVRKAVQAALQVDGVRSVRSNLEVERRFARAAPAYPAGRRGAWGAAGGYAFSPHVYHRSIGAQVTGIDRQQGRVTLRTDQGGTLDVAVPSWALQQFAQGDQVVVDLGLRATGAPAASPASGTSPGQRGAGPERPK